MFKEIILNNIDRINRIYTYTLIDSDFTVEIRSDLPDYIAICLEYMNKTSCTAKLGSNIALFCLYKELKNDPIITRQNLYCQIYINKWCEIEKERDIYLEYLSQ